MLLKFNKLTEKDQLGRNQSSVDYEMVKGQLNDYAKVDNITIKEERIDTEDAAMLLDELSDTLERITGRSGRASFKLEDVTVPRSLFVVARDESGQAVGCGAIRPFNDNTAEVKRVYARVKSSGIGRKIVSFLEKSAKNFGYKYVCIETGIVNKKAVNFYKSMGYYVIDNYGKYINNEKSICFEKKL